MAKAEMASLVDWAATTSRRLERTAARIEARDLESNTGGSDWLYRLNKLTKHEGPTWNRLAEAYEAEEAV